MKGEEQQAEGTTGEWMEKQTTAGGSEQQGRPRRRQGAVFVGRKTLWRGVKGAKFWVAELQGSKVAKRRT